MQPILKFLRLLLAMLSLASATSFAQQYPAKPVRILSNALSEALGQPFVVENKPGADGYTLFVATNTAMMQSRC